MLKLSLTTPKVNLKWWQSSRRELLAAVEQYNRESWNKEKDPVTQDKWAPRKPPTGTWPLLYKTGLMQDTAKFQAVPTKPMIFSAKTTDYGPFLQYGTRFMVQRRWLGIGDRLARRMEVIIGRNVFRGRTTIKFEYKT